MQTKWFNLQCISCLLCLGLSNCVCYRKHPFLTPWDHCLHYFSCGMMIFGAGVRQPERAIQIQKKKKKELYLPFGKECFWLTNILNKRKKNHTVTLQKCLRMAYVLVVISLNNFEKYRVNLRSPLQSEANGYKDQKFLLSSCGRHIPWDTVKASTASNIEGQFACVRYTGDVVSDCWEIGINILLRYRRPIKICCVLIKYHMMKLKVSGWWSNVCS